MTTTRLSLRRRTQTSCRRRPALSIVVNVAVVVVVSLFAVYSCVPVAVVHASLADRGRLVKYRKEQTAAAQGINRRAGGRKAVDRREESIEGPRYRSRQAARARGNDMEERQRHAEQSNRNHNNYKEGSLRVNHNKKEVDDSVGSASGSASASSRRTVPSDPTLLRPSSNPMEAPTATTTATAEEQDGLFTDNTNTDQVVEDGRSLSSQLTGCCTTYSSYSANQMCTLYGQDCESGEMPSHDSDDGECSQVGLSFIGISFSVRTAQSNPYSYQLNDQFPMENIIDRQYKYVMSMDEDGWLVGGGYKSFDYSGKMPYLDSSHTELLRIGSLDPNYGGTTISQVYSAMSTFSFPPFSIFPEYVKGGGGHNSGDDDKKSVPSGDVTLIVSVVETYESGQSSSSYELFLDDLFSAMDQFGGGPCMDDHDTDPHVSMARGVKFKSSYHQQQYFYNVNLEVAVWQSMYPNGVVIGASGYASFPPNSGNRNKEKINYGNLYFFFDRANITKAFYPNRGLSSTESYYSTLYTSTDVSSFYASTTKITFDYSGSHDDNNNYYEHNPYAWNANMAKHDMTDGWDLPPNCDQEGETFFGIPLSRSSSSKLQSTGSFQDQFDFEVLIDRNFTYIKEFGTNHGWLVGESIGNGAGSIVDKDTAHIPIFYMGTTNPEMGGMALSDMIKVGKEIDFGNLYLKPAFVFQDDDASIKLQFEADANSALGYLYDNFCKMLGIAWNYDTPYNDLGVYTNCAMHAAGDRAKYGCGPENANTGGFCPQMTLGYRVKFDSEDDAAAYMANANNYVDYWRAMYPSGVAVGTQKFCPDGGCLGLFLNRYDLYNVFKPGRGGSWVEYNGGTLAPTISPAPTFSGGCDNPHNHHLDKCFRKSIHRKATSAAWDSLGTVGQLSIFLLSFMAVTLSISMFLARAAKKRKKGESYLDFFIRDLKRRKRKQKKLRKKKGASSASKGGATAAAAALEEDILEGSMLNDNYRPAPPPRPGRSSGTKKSRSRSSSARPVRRSSSTTRRSSNKTPKSATSSSHARRGSSATPRTRSRSSSAHGHGHGHGHHGSSSRGSSRNRSRSGSRTRSSSQRRTTEKEENKTLKIRQLV